MSGFVRLTCFNPIVVDHGHSQYQGSKMPYFLPGRCGAFMKTYENMRDLDDQARF